MKFSRKSLRKDKPSSAWHRPAGKIFLEILKSVPAFLMALVYVYGLIVYSSRVIWEGYGLRLFISGAAVFVLCRGGPVLLSRLGAKKWRAAACPAGIVIMVLLAPLLKLPSNYPGPALLPSFSRSKDTEIKGKARISNRRIKLDYEVRDGVILHTNHSLNNSFILPAEAVLRFGAGIEASAGSPPFHLAVYMRDPPKSAPRKVFSTLLQRDRSRWEDMSIELGGETRRRALLSLQLSSTEEETSSGSIYISRPQVEKKMTGKKPSNIVIILVDTWRPDHLASYGYDIRNTDKYLEELYKSSGVKFENCTSPSSWTTPAVASLFTSLYPAEHGLCDVSSMVLNERQKVLPEILKKNGYDTRAYSLSFPISPSFNFSQGFYSFHDMAHYMFHWDGDMVAAERSAGYIESNPDQPFFIYFHLMNPHYPYNVGPFYKSSRPSFMKALFTENALRSGFANMFQKFFFPERPWKEDDLRKSGLLAAYDGEVVRTDEAIATIMKTLEDSGVIDNTLVIITADHGEEFKEHGGFYHKTTVYEEQVHVPLFMFGAHVKDKDRSVSCRASLVDIMPTILEAAGIEVGAGMSGVSLWDVLEGQCPERPVYTELDNRSVGGKLWEAVYKDNIKLVRVTAPGGETKTMAFDLENDPAELQPRSGLPEELKHMAALLDELHQKRERTRRRKSETRLEEQQRRTLRSLGYLE